MVSGIAELTISACRIQGDVSSKAKVKEFHAQVAAQEDKVRTRERNG